uniref:BED-type domain-containing protein n=1 Tax=Kalanchoe fedtschenkoi TaxID=63787 RepID=A0A7N0TZL9_KALFE
MDVAGETSSPVELVESSNMDAVHVESGSQAEVPENTEATGYGQRKRKKVSKVWEEFEEHVVNGVVQGMKCKHCKMVFKISKTGTTTQYKRHLDTCPKRAGVISGQQRLNLQIQASGTGNTSGASPSLRPWKYNQSRIRELMSHLVMVHELPFNFAEYEIFNLLMKEAAPDFVKVSRTTLKADCITSYNNEKKRLMEFLNGVRRVSITTDIWRSGQKIEYMVVTCHFVRDWKIHKRVLSFCHIPPPHNGLSVCDDT